MIVKEVLSEEILTLPEVHDMLIQIRNEREGEERELGYELRKAISHSELFTKLDSTTSRNLVNELSALEKMKPEIAIRIADILPLSYDEIRSIYAKERYALNEDELKQILELVIKVA